MSEIVRRLEYIARVLDTPPYNTPDEVKAIREAIDSINRYDSLVAEVERWRSTAKKLHSLQEYDSLITRAEKAEAEVEQLKQLNEKLIIAKAGWYDKFDKAEAELKRLQNSFNWVAGEWEDAKVEVERLKRLLHDALPDGYKKEKDGDNV